MKPAPFAYHDPKTLAEAVDLLANLENARLLAGGQSLMPMMNFRFVQPDHLIDLNGVESLFAIRAEGERMSFGAMVRQHTLETAAEVRRHFPIMPLALSHVGHIQTRNRGTFGGSLSHFDPSAELCNLAALFDGELVLAKKGGERAVRFADFGLGYLTTAIQPDELLREIRLRPWPADHGYGFEEFALRHGDFAVCAVSCLLLMRPSGEIAQAAIAVSGVATTPVRLREAEQALVGQRPGHESFRAAGEIAGKLEAMSDSYVTAEYRQHLARILTYRALESAAARLTRRAA